MSHERIQECVVEQPVDVPLSPVVLPQGCGCAAGFASRAHPSTHRQTVGGYLSAAGHGGFRGVAVVHQEHGQNRIAAQRVDIPALPVLEKIIVVLFSSMGGLSQGGITSSSQF